MEGGTGRLPGTSLHENVSIPGMITSGTICKVSMISSKQRGTECLHDKNCLTFAGIPVERIGTRFELFQFSIKKEI